MPWTTVAAHPITDIQNLVEVDGVVLARGYERLVGFDAAGAVVFTLDERGAPLGGNVDIVQASGGAVTLFTREGRPSRLLAVAPTTGVVTWEREIALAVDFSSIAVIDGDVFLYGADPDKRWQIVCVDGRSGETRRVMDAPPSGRSLVSMVAARGRLVIAGAEQILAVDSSLASASILFDRPAISISGYDDVVFVHVEGELVRLAAPSLEITGSRPAPAGYDRFTRVLPSAAPGSTGRVLFFQVAEEGSPPPLLLDFEGGDDRALPLDEGAYVGEAAATSEGFAICAWDAGTVTFFDAETGAPRGRLAHHDGGALSLFHAGNRLWVVGYRGLRAMSWVDGPEAPPEEPKRPRAAPAKAAAPSSKGYAPPTPAPLGWDEKKAILGDLINLFARCMAARSADHPTHLALAAEFNARFVAFLDRSPEDSVGTFAAYLSEMGLPHAVALTDVVYVRGLGREGKGGAGEGS